MNANKVIRLLCAYYATCLFVGYAPLMPGTIASFLTCVVMWLCSMSLEMHLAIVVGLFFSGWCSSSIYAKEQAVDDPSEVVIDEVVGMMITLVCLPKKIIFYCCAFLFFRFFDITKIYPINRCERLSWVGFAIMADDVVAGCMAWCCIMALYLLVG